MNSVRAKLQQIIHSNHQIRRRGKIGRANRMEHHVLDPSRGRLATSGDSGYYSDPWVTEILLPYITHINRVLEPAAGRGGMVKVLREAGKSVWCGDIIPYKDDSVTVDKHDFIRESWRYIHKFINAADGAIITSPPVHLVGAFISKALSMASEKGTVCMWLPSDVDMGHGLQKYFADNPNLYMILKPVVQLRKPTWKPRSWFLWRKGYWGPPITMYSIVDVA